MGIIEYNFKMFLTSGCKNMPAAYSNSIPCADTGTAKHFLAALLGSHTSFTIRLIWQRQNSFDPMANLPRTHFTTRLNGTGGIYYLKTSADTLSFFVNELDGSGGTSDSNIVRLRSNFIDFDNVFKARISAEQMIAEMHPSLVVESSPGKYHLYFKLDPHSTPPCIA